MANQQSNMNPYQCVVSILPTLNEHQIRELRKLLQVEISACQRNGHKYKKIETLRGWFSMFSTQERYICEKCGGTIVR